MDFLRKQKARLDFNFEGVDTLTIRADQTYYIHPGKEYTVNAILISPFDTIGTEGITENLQRIKHEDFVVKRALVKPEKIDEK